MKTLPLLLCLMEPTVNGGVLKPEYMCSTVNPFASVQADAGAGP